MKNFQVISKRENTSQNISEYSQRNEIKQCRNEEAEEEGDWALTVVSQSLGAVNGKRDHQQVGRSSHDLDLGYER